MSNLVYRYFEGMYENCKEPIICADTDLNIVYATAAALSIFGIKKNKIMHLNCVFMHKYLDALRKGISSGRGFSMDFIGPDGNSRNKFVSVPITIENVQYAVLIFTELSLEKIDNLRKYDIKCVLDSIDHSFASITTDTVSKLELIHHGKKVEDSAGMIIKNILLLRRMYNNLQAVATDTMLTNFPQTIDINKYISHITKVITRQIKSIDIKFNLQFDTEPPYVNMDVNVFEILMCNLISNAIKFSYGKSNITIQTKTLCECSRVVISDKGIGNIMAEQLFKTPEHTYDYSSHEILGTGTSVVRRIISDHGGTLHCCSLPGGGISVGFTLPKPDKYILSLKEDKTRDDAPISLCDNIVVGMAELISVSDIFNEN